MPVGEVEYLCLGALQAGELLIASFWIRPSGLDIAPPKERVHVFEHRRVEGDRDDDAKELSRLWLDVPAERRCARDRRLLRLSAELLQLMASLLLCRLRRTEPLLPTGPTEPVIAGGDIGRQLARAVPVLRPETRRRQARAGISHLHSVAEVVEEVLRV
ncbi:hypothetical protein GCM10009780_04130 [Actinomadura alba]